MDAKGDEIKDYISSVIPDGADAVWTNTGNGETVTVKKESMSESEASNFIATVTDSASSGAETYEITAGVSSFSFAHHVSESWDFYNYIAADTKVNFYIKVPSGYVTGTDISTGVFDDSTDQDSDGYYMLFSEYCDANSAYITIGFFIEKKYSVSKLDVLTSRSLTGSFTRTSEFTLENKPTDDEIAVIMDRLNSLVGIVDTNNDVESENSSDDGDDADEQTEGDPDDDSGDETDNELSDSKTEITYEDEDGVFCIKIVQNGAASDILNSTKQLTGYAGTFVYSNDFAFWKLKYDESFAEYFYFEDLLMNTTSDFTTTYQVDLGALSTITYSSAEEASVDGGKITQSYIGTAIAAERWNLWAIGFCAAIALAVILLLIAVVKSGILKRKLKPAMPVESQSGDAPQDIEVNPDSLGGDAHDTYEENTFSESNADDVQSEDENLKELDEVLGETDSTDEKTEKPKFCTNCGAPRDRDARVCVQCGTKFVD